MKTPPPPLFINEYFEVKPSPKGGLGAFALRDIPKDTVILAEKPLLKADILEIFFAYEQLTPKQQDDYKSLCYFKGISPHMVLGIFKTKRLVLSKHKSELSVTNNEQV